MMKACSSQRLFAFTILFCTLFFFHAHLIPVEAVVKVNGNVIYGGDHSVLRHIEEDMPSYDVDFVDNHSPMTYDDMRARLINPTSATEFLARVRRVKTAKKRDYLCMLPDTEMSLADSEEEEEEEKLSPVDIDNDEEARDVMEEALRKLPAQCFLRNEGWWTYEFCPMRSIRQYHEDKDSGKIVAEFSLGKYSNLESGQNRWKFVEDQFGGVATSYISERYVDGKVCDVHPNKPRETEVRWYCDLARYKGSPHLTFRSIDEPASCSYTIKLFSSVVCEHSALERYLDRVKKDVEVDKILCYPTLPLDGTPYQEKPRADRGGWSRDIENNDLFVEEMLAFMSLTPADLQVSKTAQPSVSSTKHQVKMETNGRVTSFQGTGSLQQSGGKGGMEEKAKSSADKRVGTSGRKTQQALSQNRKGNQNDGRMVEELSEEEVEEAIEQAKMIKRFRLKKEAAQKQSKGPEGFPYESENTKTTGTWKRASGEEEDSAAKREADRLEAIERIKKQKQRREEEL